MMLVECRFGVCLLLLFLSMSCKQAYIATIEEQSLTVAAPAKPDSRVQTLIAPYRQKMGQAMQDTLGVLTVQLTMQGNDFSLGNWLADICRSVAADSVEERVDLAILNSGGIRRSSLSQGPLRRAQLFELLPFDNQLVVLELSSADLRKLITHSAAYGGWPVSKGLRYRIQGDKPVELSYRGKALTAKQHYLVAMPDYIANGGDDCTFLRDTPRIATLGIMRSLVIAYIKERSEAGEPLNQPQEPRIITTPQK